MSRSIFITYNPKSVTEESTALRLQTISNLYGLNVMLPYRLGAGDVSMETLRRIKESSFVVSLCLVKLSKQQNVELQAANKLKKSIVIIYDKSKGKQENFKGHTNIKEVSVDFSKTDDALHEIASFLRNRFKVSKTRKVSKKQQEEDSGLGVALLGIGLGLLAVWALSKDE